MSNQLTPLDPSASRTPTALAEGPSPSAGQHRTRRFEQILRLFIQVADILLVNVAFIAAYYLRYIVGLGGDVPGENFVGYDVYLPLQAGLTLTLFCVYHVAGLYRWLTRMPFLEESWNILLSSTLGLTLIFAGVFLIRGFAYSRGLFLIAWVLTVLLLVAVRIGARVVKALLRRRGIGVQRVLVVGGDHLGRTIMHIIATEPGISYQLIGFVHNAPMADIGRFKCLGNLDALVDITRLHQIDEIIITLSGEDRDRIREITELCTQYGVSYKIVPDLFEMSLTMSRVDVEDLRGVPVIGMSRAAIAGWDQVLKRGMDVVIGVLIIAALLPLWLVIAVAIKLDSPGPVLFMQTRLGKGSRPFPAWKFRSMHAAAEEEVNALWEHNEASGPLFKIRQDPRITRMGRWLRRTSLDELPQLMNVLRGEMSLVGPRPPLPAEVEQYQEWHRKRLKVAPGMTGLWQVSGRSELPFDEMVLLDVYYIENWSLGLDFQILLRTVPAVLTGRGAF